VQAFRDGLAHELAQPVPWPGGPLTVTASIGIVAIADLQESSASVALERADDAMYAAKKARGGHGRRSPRRTPAESPGSRAGLDTMEGTRR
jgi:GGDEF domain-containing protein